MDDHPVDEPAVPQQNPPTEPAPAVKAGWARATIFFVVYLGVLVGVELVLGLVLQAMGFDIEGLFALTADPLMIPVYTLILLVTLLVIFVFRRWLDHRSMVSLGFEFDRSKRLHLVYGFAWGTGMMAAVFVILLLAGAIEVTAWQAPGWPLLMIFIVMVLAAAQEEFVSRGYLLNNYMASMNKYLALLLVSVLFAAAHGGNPNVSLVAVLNIVLAGLVLGIYYVHRKNLWFPVGMHLGWNFFEGTVFGSPVSGLKIRSIIDLKFTGNPLITGGDFGFEASAVTAVVLIVATITIHLQYRRKGETLVRNESAAPTP